MLLTRRRALQWGAWGLPLAHVRPTLAATQPLVLSGVAFEPQVQLQGRRLLLNGAGVRYKAVFKVYAAGLYLEQKASTPAEVQDQSGPKRIRVAMLRDINSAELGKLFSRGMEDNMDKTAFTQLIPGVLRMSQIFSDHKRLLAGEEFTVDLIPGTGVQVSVKGMPQGEPIREPAFFSALLGIWLGPQPADWNLRNALLGKG